MGQNAMTTANESSLDAFTFARNMRQLRDEERGRLRRMALRARPAQNRLKSVLWWVWPTSWAAVLSTVYFASDALRELLAGFLVNAGF